MAINISVYSNANAASKVINFEFYGDVLAANDEIIGTNTSAIEYYIKASTGARLDDNTVAPIKVLRKMDDLALMGNGVGTGKSHSISQDNTNYTTIKQMITDYVYDYVHGHVADQFGTGCRAQRPIKFR